MTLSSGSWARPSASSTVRLAWRMPRAPGARTLALRSPSNTPAASSSKAHGSPPTCASAASARVIAASGPTVRMTSNTVRESDVQRIPATSVMSRSASAPSCRSILCVLCRRSGIVMTCTRSGRRRNNGRPHSTAAETCEKTGSLPAAANAAAMTSARCRDSGCSACQRVCSMYHPRRTRCSCRSSMAVVSVREPHPSSSSRLRLMSMSAIWSSVAWRIPRWFLRSRIAFAPQHPFCALSAATPVGAGSSARTSNHPLFREPSR